MLWRRIWFDDCECPYVREQELKPNECAAISSLRELRADSRDQATCGLRYVADIETLD